MPQSTQLAAIMVTDIVGYDDLLKSDKDKAMLLTLKNKTIQEPLLEKHNGRWLKDMSDGSWASFENTLDAVNCAREIQATMKLQPNFEISINIHLGEVLYQENELVGEAISTATEIRSRNSTSGVFISEAIFNTIRNNQSVNLNGLENQVNDVRNIKDSVHETSEEELSMDNTLLKNLTEAVNRNIENEQFGVEDLASEVSLSRSHLHRKLQQLNGQSISQFIRSIRLKKAMEFLEKDVATVSEIAYRVGFGSPTYFIKCFHEHYGYPPGEVKKRQNNKLEEGGAIETEYMGEQELSSQAESVRLYHVKDTWNKAVVNRFRAVILITDIVGYSRIKASDAGTAKELLNKNLELHKNTIKTYQGTLIKSIGDSVLAYFMEPEQGFQCAVKLQFELRKSGEYAVRIALNTGNIILEDDEVYGEGLNVTSKLAQLGSPGSILLSQRMMDELGHDSERQTLFLGSFELSGINRSVGIYALEGSGLTIPDENEIRQYLQPSYIEGLESHSSKQLILDIFEEMENIRPELRSLNQGGETDIRILAYQIILNYPWPVSVELRRLFSAALRETGLRRLIQLVKTIDRLLRFLTFILLTENSDRKGEPIGSVDFPSKLRNLSSHDLIELIRLISTYFRENKIPYFMTEMEEVFDDLFFNEISNWSDEKNSVLERGPDLNDDQLLNICSKLENQLVFLMKRTAFMIRYRLVNVGSIKVLKTKNNPAKFEHSIDILNSPDSEFRTKNELLDNFSDSNAVLIMKNINDPENFLNLSPLLIDTHHENIGTRSKLRRDIFLYDHFRDGNIYYSGTEVTEKTDLTGLSNYESLLKEFEFVVKSISKEGGDS